MGFNVISYRNSYFPYKNDGYLRRFNDHESYNIPLFFVAISY